MGAQTKKMDSSTLWHRGQEISLTELSGKLKNITPQELMIIQARIDDKSFFSFDNGAKDIMISSLIVRICAMVGCNIPPDDYLDVLEEMLLDFLSSFELDVLSYQEMILAFKINAIGYSGELEIDQIKFTGRNLGVEYIANVLKNYMKQRNLLEGKMRNCIDGYNGINRF